MDRIDGTGLGMEVASGLLLLSYVVLALWAFYGHSGTLPRKAARFPFSIWRLLWLVIVWNGLVLADRIVLGVVGPLTCFALLGVGGLALTAPTGRLPGRWLTREECIGRRWTIACRLLGGHALLMLLVVLVVSMLASRGV